MMKPVKVAQVGMAHDHAKPTLDTMLSNPAFEVIGVADVPGDQYTDLPHYTVDELLSLDGLEAVAIETAEEDATAMAQRFAERGIAIHLDKPGSPDLAAFEKLIATIKEKNIPFQQGYMYRYNPTVQEMMKEIENGTLGKIFSVEAQMSVHHTEEKRAWLGNYPGGMLYFLGCHLIDMVYRIMGEPQEVIPLNGSTGLEGIDSTDYGFVAFRYETGVSFIKSCAREVNGFERRQLVVCGSRGTYELKPWEDNAVPPNSDYLIHTRYRRTMTDEKTNPWFDCSLRLDSGFFSRYGAMMQDFAELVRGKENPYTPDYELRLFRLLMKCCGVEK